MRFYIFCVSLLGNFTKTMIQDIAKAIPMGVILAFTIGPVFFVLLETSILKGFRAAMMFDLGVILGDIFFILVAYFTTSNLLEKIKDNPLLFFVGGIIMFVYGIIAYLKQRKDYKKHTNLDLIHLRSCKSNYTSLFIKGFLLNAINIGVLIFWLGTIIIFMPRLNFDENRILIFFTTIIVTYLLVDIIKILISKQLRHKLTPKNIHQVKQAINIVLIIFGIILTLQGFFPNAKQKISDNIENFME